MTIRGTSLPLRLGHLLLAVRNRPVIGKATLMRVTTHSRAFAIPGVDNLVTAAILRAVELTGEVPRREQEGQGMNLRALNLKWTLAFLAAAALGVVGVVLVLTLMGGGDEQATAQSDSATPLATLPSETSGATASPGPAAGTATPITPGAIKPELPSYPVVIPTLPPDFTLAEKGPCPDGWGRISDDMANYSICVPAGWGMPNPDTGEPMADVVLHYGEAHIYNPEAFPRPVGKAAEAPLDPEADFLTIVLFPIRTDASLGGGCEAKPGGSVAGLPAATCEYRFDPVPYWDQVAANPSGNWTARLMFVPLPGAKPPVGPGGQPLPTPKGGPYSTGLGISVSARNEVMDRYRETVSDILATLQVMP